MSPHGTEIWLSQVIKHRLCRRGKCRKNHKRNNTDKGVALSMDDVKRHVSAGHAVGAAGSLVQLRGCPRCVVEGGGVTVLGSAWERSGGTRQRCCGETGLALRGGLGETSVPSVLSILCPTESL